MTIAGQAFSELLIDCKEDRTLWAVLIGMLREAAYRWFVGASLATSNRVTVGSTPAASKTAHARAVETDARHESSSSRLRQTLTIRQVSLSSALRRSDSAIPGGSRLLSHAATRSLTRSGST